MKPSGAVGNQTLRLGQTTPSQSSHAARKYFLEDVSLRVFCPRRSKRHSSLGVAIAGLLTSSGWISFKEKRTPTCYKQYRLCILSLCIEAQRGEVTVEHACTA
jgi:hypothetical protein